LGKDADDCGAPGRGYSNRQCHWMQRGSREGATLRGFRGWHGRRDTAPPVLLRRTAAGQDSGQLAGGQEGFVRVP